MRNQGIEKSEFHCIRINKEIHRIYRNSSQLKKQLRQLKNKA